MITVTLLDKDNHGRLAVDLPSILGALGDLTRNMRWAVSDCEALGAGAEALYAVQNAGFRVSSEKLLSIARQLDQVIDGMFCGYAESEPSGSPVVILTAVDSTSWDVSSNDAEILNHVRENFPEAYEAGDVGYGAKDWRH
ncbi:MAG: hypothetical protein U0359_42200 [Byssovorax sp.]